MSTLSLAVLMMTVTVIGTAVAEDAPKKLKTRFPLWKTMSWKRSDSSKTTGNKASIRNSSYQPTSEFPQLGTQKQPYDPEVGEEKAAVPESDDPLEDKAEDSPRQLKKITEISPFANYEPNPVVRANDPEKNLCPTPDEFMANKPKEDEVPKCPPMTFSQDEYQGRNFGRMHYHWEAPNTHYNPLYFEDFTLERYGHTHRPLVQPFVSVGKFGLQLIGLPYQMTLHPAHEQTYPLGYYKPGQNAPRLIYQIPLNAKAAAATAGFYTGAVLALP